MPGATSYSETKARERTFLVAVAGNPNSGKTTVFNALTGLRHKVGNYPGVTVEKREGLMTGGGSIRLLDLPGAYSLSARSPDEEIAREVLLGHVADTPKPDAILMVVDANNLERNLYLASQVIELGTPVIVACNMIDLLEHAGHRLDARKLSRRLGVPVIPTVGHRGKGLDALRSAIRVACSADRTTPKGRQWSMPEAIEREVEHMASVISAHGYAQGSAAEGAAILLISEGQPPQGDRLPAAVRESVAAAVDRLIASPDTDPSLEVTAARYAWLGELVDDCLERAELPVRSPSDRIDRIFTHKVWGMVGFVAMMAGMFYSIFVLADPLMAMIENAVRWAQDLVATRMPPGVVQDLIGQGVIAGVGNVIVFFPQICILFLFIALLEDTGYMARAAFLMDRIMSRVGLHGKSFIPLLSSHACAIPGIMATRTIESPKDRLATILVAPLMSCSARLPVYTVLIAACLPGSAWTKAGVMLAMYLLGITAGLTMATVFKKTLLKGPTPAFIMELPPYRVPRLRAVLRVMWDRSKVFLTRAGTVILAITVLLWVLMSYPRNPERAARYEAQRSAVRTSGAADRGQQLNAISRQEAAENLQHSFAGTLGRLVEPALRPLGYDWRIGVGVIASFAAREVFVSTMGIVYSVGQAHGESTTLREQIRAATWPDGSKVFTPLVAISLMVFFVLACQCASTIAVVRRETNSWRWPVFMFVYMSALAYVAALLVYQVGSALCR